MLHSRLQKTGEWKKVQDNFKFGTRGINKLIIRQYDVVYDSKTACMALSKFGINAHEQRF
jgi:hypothetical protein